MFREFLRHLSLELYRSPQTVEAYATDLRGFNDFIVKAGVITDDTGFFVPGDVTRADIREWVSTLSEEGLKATSIRRKIQSVRAFYRFLMKTGQAERNPASDIPLPKKPRKLPEITTPGDIEEVMDRETELRDRLIFEMLYGCGLRRAELLSVTDSDINPYTRELRITGKGSKTRVIPLVAALMADIKEWQQERDRLFPDLPQPRPLIVTRHGAMSASMLYKIVHRKLSGTTATRKSPHTLRHTFATSLLNNGADINSVKELLGHSSLGATQIYTHLAFADLKKDWNQAHPRAEGLKRERKEDKK